jgi:hypothetical protein
MKLHRISKLTYGLICYFAAWDTLPNFPENLKIKIPLSLT